MYGCSRMHAAGRLSELAEAFAAEGEDDFDDDDWGH
jgi:hypothetical protein